MLVAFQGILAILTLTNVVVGSVRGGWRWLYVFVALILVGFVGVWLGARFVEALSWIALLQNTAIDSMGVYTDLFWFGLGATAFYVAMILMLRRSYGKLVQLGRAGSEGFIEPIG